MELESQDIDLENLRQMPYTDLRKLASKFGIQQMKADKLVSAIISKLSDSDNDADCFSTPAAKLLNSSKKNKEKVFDDNQKTPFATPRRGTFTVETPSFVIPENLFATLDDNASDLDESNVTFSRGSERKLRSRKVSFLSPTLTPRTLRSQSLRNRPKTPIAARTPLSEIDISSCNSVEPKTKSPNKPLLGSPETKVAKLAGESEIKTENVEKKISTPLPSSVQKSGKNARKSKAKISPKNTPDVKAENVGKKIRFTPLPSSAQKPEKSNRLSRAKISFKNSEDIKAISTEVNSSTPRPADKQKVDKSRNVSKSKISLNIDKGNTKKESTVKEPTSLKKKHTPNFKRIHQKAFDKMESIDDYQKRKMMNSAKKLAQQSKFQSKVTKAKSKIPAFSGIPLICSSDLFGKSSTQSKGNRIMTIDPTSRTAPPRSKENVFKYAINNKPVGKAQNMPKIPLSAKSKSKLASETSLRKKVTPLSAKSKFKFDLNQSLSRKLNYKPHRGPLKPLSAANSTVHSTSILPTKEPVESKVVIKNRSQNRSLIRGVRMNKRFELQMKNRK